MKNSEQFTLAKILNDRSCYEKFYPYIAAIKNMTREMRLVTTLIKSFYDAYPKATSVSQQEFITYIQSVDKGGHAATITEFVMNLYALDISNDELTLDIVESFVEKHMAARILDKVAKVLDHDKGGIVSTIQDDVDEFHRIIRNPPRDVLKPYKVNVGRLIRNQINAKGLPMVIPGLTKEICGARESTLGMIFAFVDTGKTSFGIANMCAQAAYIHQHDPMYDRPLVYAGNEEDEERVALRFTQCMTGFDNAQIAARPRDVKRRLKDGGMDHIRILNGINHISHVERIMDRLNPRVLMIDQGTKVKFGKGMDVHETATLGALFNMYRELSKQYKCTIICMAQANGEADEMKWITLSNLYGSKVAIPGELDWAVGLGIDTDAKYRTWRFINLCKNKFGEKKRLFSEFDHTNCEFKEVQSHGQGSGKQNP